MAKLATEHTRRACNCGTLKPCDFHESLIDPIEAEDRLRDVTKTDPSLPGVWTDGLVK